MTRIGTAYFPSLRAALAYYADYGEGPRDVQRKIAAHEIHIGKPLLLPGQKLVLIDRRTRYAIEESVS